MGDGKILRTRTFIYLLFVVYIKQKNKLNILQDLAIMINMYLKKGVFVRNKK